MKDRIEVVIAAKAVIVTNKGRFLPPASPPSQVPRLGTGLPLAAYKAAWNEALAKSSEGRK